MSFFSSAMSSIVQDGVAVVKSALRAWGLTVETKIDEGAWTVVTKQTDEARSSTATLADDAELKFAMEANTKYLVRGRIFFDTAATPDLKFGFNGPTSPTRVRVETRSVVPGATAYGTIAVASVYETSGIAVAGSGTTGGFIAFEAIIENGSTAGDFVFTWAQNTSNASSTTVLRGSYLEHRKVTP